MDFPTRMLFDTHGGVCGCPELWGKFSSHPARLSSLSQDYQAQLHNASTIPSTSPTATRSTLYSAPVYPTTLTASQSPNHTECSDRLHLSMPPSNIASSSSASSGLLKQTCFFWYHGECRRNEDCHLAHDAHVTWPITIPPGYVHRVPCYLPLCPANQSIKAFQKSDAYNESTHKLGSQRKGTDRNRPKEAEHMTDTKVEGTSESDTSTDTSTSSSRGEDIDEDDLSTTSSSESDNSNDVEDEEGTTTASSDSEKGEIISISHPGTLTSHRCKRAAQRNSLPSGVSKRAQRSPFVFARQNNTQFDLPPRLRLNLGALGAAQHHPPPVRGTPTAPRAFHRHQDPPICFHWYHKGYCRPKFRNGRRARCNYLHTLRGGKVSLPPGITYHDPNCPLPLCPVQSRDRKKMDSDLNLVDQGFKPRIKTELDSPLRSAPLPLHSSSPRDAIKSVRPKYGTSRRQLPKLMGNKRQRFKKQRDQIEQWQKAHGIEQVSMEDMRAKQIARKRERRHRRQERKRRRQVTATVPGMTALGVQAKKEPEEDVTAAKSGLVVLVDYELPEGEDRADWDTDAVRKTFGEIE